MHAFKSSTYFPPRQSLGASQLQLAIDSGLPVWAQDVSSTGAKRFFACGYEYFCNLWYRNLRDKHLYEVIQYGRPTKVYLDLDAPRARFADKAAFDQEMLACVDAVQRALGLSGCSYLAMDSSSETKWSRHVVLQVLLRSVSVVQEAVERALRLRPSDCVDTTVYTRNRCFRILHSSKLGKQARLGSGQYCPSELLLSFVQAVPPPHYLESTMPFSAEILRAGGVPTLVHEVDWPQAAAASTAAVLERKMPVLTSVDASRVARLVMRYGGALAGTVRENDAFVNAIVTGLECPFKGAAHKSNNQYFTIAKASGKAWFTCADKACTPLTPYDMFDASFLFRDLK